MFDKELKEITLEDIKDIVFNKKIRENEILDYKAMFYNRRHQNLDWNKKKQEFIKDVTAFANAKGGYFIYGVDDDLTTIQGIPDDIKNNKIDDWISGVLKANIAETIKYDLHFIPYDNPENQELYIVILYIHESDHKPIFVRVDNKDVCYLRKGSSIFTANKFDLQAIYEAQRSKQTKETSNTNAFQSFNASNLTITATYLAGGNQIFNQNITE